MSDLHNLLKRQLRRFTNGAMPSRDDQTEFLQAVNEAYQQFDEDRRMLEHSLELTSQELLERNAELTRINAELEERVKERTASLQSSLDFIFALNQVAQSLLDFEDLEHVLESIADVVSRTISADRVALILFDHEDRKVTNVVGAGPGADQIIRSVSYDELMEGLTGWVLRELKPAVSPKDKPDPRESPAVQKRRRETDSGSIIVLPLSQLGETFGTLKVINRPEQPDFSQQEITWLEIIAIQASATIARTQIYEQLNNANLVMERQSERLKQELIDRQHAEAALEESEAELRTLFAAMHDVIIVFDQDARYVQVAPTSTDLMVASPNEMLGKTAFDLLSPELAKTIYDAIQEVIRTQQPIHVEYQIEIKAQAVWKDAVVAPRTQDTVFWIAHDITERKLNEETIRHQNDVLANLHQITLDLLKHRNVDELLDALVDSSARFFGTSFVEIMLAEDDSLVVKAATKNQSGLIGMQMGRKDAMLSWQAFETREPVVLDDYVGWQQHQTVYDEFSLHAVAIFPIMNDDQCLGVLGLGRDEPGNEFNTNQIQFGRLFANLTALVLNNVQLREALHKQSIHDPLTGLYNRRYMEEAFRQHISRVTRNLHTLGVIMLDIDHFKHFNDTHGHPAGDALLREVGAFLQRRLRVEDIACRYGGEEFVLIMPDAPMESVHKRAEQLRREIKDLQVEYGGIYLEAVTFSLGVAIYPVHGSTQDSVLRAADDALYRAKQGGRDQVMLAERLA